MQPYNTFKLCRLISMTPFPFSANHNNLTTITTRQCKANDADHHHQHSETYLLTRLKQLRKLKLIHFNFGASDTDGICVCV